MIYCIYIYIYQLHRVWLLSTYYLDSYLVLRRNCLIIKYKSRTSRRPPKGHQAARHNVANCQSQVHPVLSINSCPSGLPVCSTLPVCNCQFSCLASSFNGVQGSKLDLVTCSLGTWTINSPSTDCILSALGPPGWSLKNHQIPCMSPRPSKTWKSAPEVTKGH